MTGNPKIPYNNYRIMVKAEHISKKLGKKEVLRDAFLFAAPGECVGVIGANGCGKSTFLSILAGVEKPDAGTILFFRREPLKERGVFSSMCGFVPQGNPLMEDLSVRDNLSLWSKKRKEQLAEVVERFQLADMLSMPVKKLSGGMKRRVSIACAAADDVPILILDEPTAALDIYQKENIHDFIRNFTGRNGIVIMATHDSAEIEMCDRVYLMEDGCTKEMAEKRQRETENPCGDKKRREANE